MPREPEETVTFCKQPAAASAAGGLLREHRRPRQREQRKRLETRLRELGLDPRD